MSEVRNRIKRLEVLSSIDKMYALASEEEFEELRREYEKFVKKYRNSRIKIDREYVEKLETVSKIVAHLKVAEALKVRDLSEVKTLKDKAEGALTGLRRLLERSLRKKV